MRRWSGQSEASIKLTEACQKQAWFQEEILSDDEKL
jgi:hypothetical protein